MCHIILMMPILGLPVFWVWPVEIALPVYTVIFSLSIFFYFLIIRAQREPVRSGQEAMLHQIGRVIAPLSPLGLIRLRGEIWQAFSSERIPRGEQVEVVALEGLTLLVRRPGATTRSGVKKHCP